MTAKDETKTPEPVQPKAAKVQELRGGQIWEEGPHENPFQRQTQALIADVKKNTSGVLWVKFSAYLPNVGNQPFEYLNEKNFRNTYSTLVPSA